LLLALRRRSRDVQACACRDVTVRYGSGTEAGNCLYARRIKMNLFLTKYETRARSFKPFVSHVIALRLFVEACDKWRISIRITSGYGRDGRGVQVRLPVGAKIFSPRRRPDRFQATPSFLCSCTAIRPGRGTNYSPSTNAAGDNVRSIYPLRIASME
jgi:hypothetical protein